MMRTQNPLNTLPYDILLLILPKLGFLDWVALICTEQFFKELILSNDMYSPQLWNLLTQQSPSYFSYFKSENFNTFIKDRNLIKADPIRKDEIKMISMILAHDYEGIEKHKFAIPFGDFTKYQHNDFFLRLEEILIEIDDQKTREVYYKKLKKWHDTEEQTKKLLNYQALFARIGIICNIDPDQVCSEFNIENIEQIKRLFRKDANLICLAAKFGRLAWVKKLCELGDNLTSHPQTTAIYNGQLDVLNYFIEVKKIDVNEFYLPESTVSYSSSGSALYLSIEKPSNNFIIQDLIKRGLIVVDQKCTTDLTLFFAAILHRNLALAKWLADNGANINYVMNLPDSSYTPLFESLVCPDLNAFQFLIELPGIDVNLPCRKSNKSMRPLAKALYRRFYNEALLLINKKALISFDEIGQNDSCDFFYISVNSELLSSRIQLKEKEHRYSEDQLIIAHNHACLIALKNAHDYFTTRNQPDEAKAIEVLFDICATNLLLPIWDHLDNWKKDLKHQDLMQKKHKPKTDAEIKQMLSLLFQKKNETELNKIQKSELGDFIKILESSAMMVINKHRPQKMEIRYILA